MHIYFDLRKGTQFCGKKNYHFNKITTKVLYMLIDYKMLYFIVICIIFILYPKLSHKFGVF